MKTSELTGAALDWAVAKCLNVDEYILNESFMTRWTDDDDECVDYHYSSDWSQGGPIIEREGMNLHMESPDEWHASMWWDDTGGAGDILMKGPTPLVAAMRCYVASKLGSLVDVPKELT